MGRWPQLSKPGEPGYYIQVDRVTYDDDPPWPTEPDGSSDYTLSRKVAGNYGNDVINWQADGPTPGRDNDQERRFIGRHSLLD